jgi:hypothetical protein
MTSHNQTNSKEINGATPSSSNEAIGNLEQDVASLSYLLSTLRANTQPDQSGDIGKTVNGTQTVEEGEEETPEELRELEELEELLRRLEGAESIASGVEGRVDTLLATLDDLLGTLDETSKPQEVEGAVTEDSESKPQVADSGSMSEQK